MRLNHSPPVEDATETGSGTLQEIKI